MNAEDLRHVLIEHLQKEELCKRMTLNLHLMVKMDILFINKVGKSSLIKSVGISMIMAQSGCYAPCSRMIYYLIVNCIHVLLEMTMLQVNQHSKLK